MRTGFEIGAKPDVFSPLKVKFIAANEWELTAPLTYHNPHGKEVTVPKGFRTDFASIPKFLHSVLNPAGKYVRAAVLHDWLYWHRPLGNDAAGRKAADWMFLEAMQLEGVSWLARNVMYRAVRDFGALVWARRDKPMP